MIKRTKELLLAGLLMVAGQGVSSAETTNNLPDFQEVYQLIKAHAAVNEAELNRAAVEGLLSALGPKASLVTRQQKALAAGPVLSKTAVFDENIGYVRIAHVADALGKELNNAYRQIDSTNALSGLVLDLRYADGTDYAVTAATAELFVPKSQPLLNWGKGVVTAHEKTNAIQVPIAILVNGKTSGSAEALAAVLRSAGVGLILGGKTAGQAMVAQDFPLKNGDQLRVATAPVTLGNGTALSSQGVKPDIEVTVNPEDEHAYYADEFFVVRRTNQVAAVTGSATNQVNGTNGTRRARFSEAELVREHRAGLDGNSGESARTRDSEPEKPVVNDPALARALDLLKGLAVVRQTRS